MLPQLTKRTEGVSATIHTRYSEQFLTDLKKHNEQYPEIQFIQLSHRNHDRFLIIDDKVHFLGVSLKDMGAGLCAVTEMTTPPKNHSGIVEIAGTQHHSAALRRRNLLPARAQSNILPPCANISEASK